MYKIQPVIEHIQKVYGFEVVPCSIPRDNFQYFKRGIYILIHNKISKKLFYFLRDKVSPIKFLDERPKGEIWFRKRNSEGKVSIEVEIKPLPTYQFIFSNDSSGLFHPINKEGENYEVKIYEQLSDVENIEFPLNHINGKEQVDYYFSKVDELKQILRDYKLKNILN
jgi:hypothetical protein